VICTIDGITFNIPVFFVGNVPWTSSIKLSEGIHTINEFVVYSDNHTPNDISDDVVLWATPHTGSQWATYVSTPLVKNFNIVKDQKIPVNIDVVCFMPATYLNFGFTYFSMNELVIRQQWFFGDICMKDASQYVGSDYAHQANWVDVGYSDRPAIFQLKVYKYIGNAYSLQNTFTNDDVDHQYGNKVSVTYGDYLNKTDQFKFELYILVRQGTSFNFVLFKTWTFNDQSNIIQSSDDNVVNFIIGNCYDQNNPPAYIFPPWVNLPATATYTITAFPSQLGGYIDATLSSIPTGYDILNGVYASNCADHQTTINIGTAYNMDIYSSMYPNLLPAFAQSDKWAKINWLYNHLDWYPNYTWADVQGCIWLWDNPAWDGSAENGMPALSTLYWASKMYADANIYGLTYKVLPGGYCTIIFIEHGTPPDHPIIQTMFIKIDP
jgi:hypothetical protein